MDLPDSPSSNPLDSPLSGMRERHLRELENLTLTARPVKTLRYFTVAIGRYVRQFMARGGSFVLFTVLVLGLGIATMTIGGPHEKHMQELIRYLQFGLWWLALGVASSIGLGSGLHTFVLYLGPHIALFTMKAVQCGRVDLKSAPYDTIQLKSSPSWMNRNCSEYGPPLFSNQQDSRLPLSSILSQVQLEAVLWGIGTALGELPPFFISRAARIAGSELEVMKELDSSSTEDGGVVANHVNRIKLWLLSHSQYLNFVTILVLASVPNPLFDLAGIMCGQFGIPFWTFFVSTMVGKAFIKTHIQTIFLISVCNNQLLDLVENKLIRLLSIFPGFGLIAPKLIAKLHILKEKYMDSSPQAISNSEVKKWNFSIGAIWNTVVWLMIINFFIKIVSATAQTILKEEHEKEMSALTSNIHASDLGNIVSATAQNVLKKEHKKELTALRNNLQASELSKAAN
ncbi:PREDICTED: vacuole membrane protein KMS1-like [Fragaria vesca subsp. vesca]|uniref:vacuole membrane protein KMS1-like n=1 Tax=Fragaria vesca subsp. vesca TaxID=101020 RepID=UPI0002C2EE80|nr:PREDICTED: vacuole membrane protein KMS1-like [Fragaria vesca subsp. vesca]